MLRASTTRRALRRVQSSAAKCHASSSPNKPASSIPPPAPPQDAVAAAAAKNSIGSSTVAPSTAPASSTSSSSSSSGGSFFPKLLFLSALSTPAGAAFYLNQNPTWNPEFLRGNENWIKFRELVLGKDAAAAPAAKKPAVVAKAVPVTPKRDPSKATPVAPKEPSKTPEQLSAVISKAQSVAPAGKKETPVVKATVAPAAKKPEPAAEKKEDTKTVDSKKEATKSESVVKAVETKTPKVVKKDVAIDTAAAAAAVVDDAKHVVDDAKDAVVDAKHAIEKQVDEATQNARDEITKLASEANLANLSDKVEKKIQATTKEILDALKADASAAAADVDKNYLDGIHELDANSLAIRVAQLATEMKHRSKWEAVRLLEALRRMEEDAQKKSGEVLQRQDELHKELVAKELRLQEELLTRKYRNDIEKLKKDYAEDLARNVNQQRTTILNKLQETFAREKKIIEDRYAQQLRSKSEELQETLTKERKQRVAEMESYRAQLRALNTVLDNSSTYEAFSHHVHKTSVAALALSDRIEAAAPLRAEIRALREAARSDPFIEVALKTLPQQVIDEGAPSVSQLQERFKVVKKVGHRAALAPASSGLVGQLFGGALSYLIIPPGGPIEGNDTDAIFSRADYALKAGDIESAIHELKSLSGTPAEVSKDWISAAESRLAVEQTAKVVKAHVALLAASCS